tara:strand:+ start:182 stop:361 length:180 start_codon:yes stop_codon:yes gene_type:complete
MLVTIFIKRGVKKSIHLPYEALDEVRKLVYNNRDRFVDYSVCISDHERIKNVELLEECN